MFGFSLRLSQDPTRLVVTDPISYWALFVWGLMTVVPFLMFVFSKYQNKRKAIVWFVIVLVAASFMSVTRLTLDKATGTAKIDQFVLLHWTSRSMPLDHIDNAFVRTGSTTSALTLQYADGSIFMFSGLDQSGGKYEAAHAINAFLGRQTTAGQ